MTKLNNASGRVVHRALSAVHDILFAPIASAAQYGLVYAAVAIPLYASDVALWLLVPIAIGFVEARRRVHRIINARYDVAYMHGFDFGSLTRLSPVVSVDSLLTAAGGFYGALSLTDPTERDSLLVALRDAAPQIHAVVVFKEAAVESAATYDEDTAITASRLIPEWRSVPDTTTRIAMLAVVERVNPDLHATMTRLLV